MKEVTTITTIEITNITLVEDDELEETLAANYDPEIQRNVENWMKQTLGLDDVKVKKIKPFVMDAKEEKND